MDDRSFKPQRLYRQTLRSLTRCNAAPLECCCQTVEQVSMALHSSGADRLRLPCSSCYTLCYSTGNCTRGPSWARFGVSLSRIQCSMMAGCGSCHQGGHLCGLRVMSCSGVHACRPHKAWAWSLVGVMGGCRRASRTMVETAARLLVPRRQGAVRQAPEDMQPHT